MCLRIITTLLCVFNFFYSSGQVNKQIKVCVQSPETLKGYKIQLIRLSAPNEKIVANHHITTECIDLKINNTAVYRILVQSDCCSYFGPQWKSDTIKNDYVFEVVLKEKILELKELVVKEKKDRFERSGDTLFVNITDADARPHAAASTLFDRITGLNYSWGGVSILGEEVQEITIDGKRIFGGVSQLTLESIKANMIERMEFIEKTLANGQKKNVLNIKLKSDKKNGVYGHAGAGLGTDLRYIGNVNINKITKKGFLNAFTTANSINEKGIDPKAVERVLLNGFRNNLNASSSVIGLYEPRTIDNSIEKLETSFKGINRYFDTGANYTYAGDKIEFDGFYFGNINRQKFVQVANRQQFFSDLTQISDSRLTDNSRLRNINSNFNLKWNIDARTNLRISNQLNTLYKRKSIDDSLMSNFSDNISKNIILSESQSKLNTIAHTFQLSLIQKGKRGGFVSSLYYRLTNQFNVDSNRFSNKFENSVAIFTQNQAIKRKDRLSLHQVQLVQSVPLNSQFLIEGKIKGIFEEHAIRQNTIVNLPNEALIPAFGMVKNNIFETGIYVLYKRAKVDVISGLAYSYCDIQRQNTSESFSLSPSFILNPFTKVEYRLASGKFSARFAKEPVLPGSTQLIALPDSSNLNNITVGNIRLSHYSQKSFDLSANISAQKGYQFNLNFNYKILDKAIISENIYQSGLNLFSSTFINTPGSTSNWNLNLSALQVKLRGSFSWILLGGVYHFNTLIKTREEVSPLNLNVAFLNLNTSFKYKSIFNLKANWQSQFNILQKNSVINNIIHLKSELDLGKKWYFDTGLRLNINKSQTINSQLFADTEVSKFLFKNNIMKASLLIKNIFNTNHELNIEQANNYQSVIYTNILPRTVLFKLTFYPESWKK
jgi:hypothetical protein